MCTATVAQVILDSLNKMTSAGKVFTAYDVTVEARKQTRDNIRHNDVRKIVGQEFGTNQMPANYLREQTLLETDAGPQLVLVYFPDDKDESDHPKAIKDEEEDNIFLTPSSVVFQAHKAIDDSEIIVEPTKEGRINIPKKIIDKVIPDNGFYDIVFLGKIIHRCKNQDGRMRIHRHWIGNGVGTKFKVVYISGTNSIGIEQI